MRILEFGSGRSTSWFARRVGQVASIEHSSQWFARVQADLSRERLSNVDLRLIPLDHNETAPEQEHYNPLPNYVGILGEFDDESLDLVVVDGHYRTTCIRTCPPKLKQGGLLLVDDINWLGGPGGVPVPEEWELVHVSGTRLKTTGIWKKVRPAQ